ncbi:MAG TPA: IreB family regulatory phosphoprotein [Candidatus Onthousia faecavium]|nr:IreB family regulatory phosphoprotein [Candidatus Onthousia faecavium]
MDDKTRLFRLVSNDQAKVHKTLLEVYNSLKERGYNPIDQIVGYLISGDLGYISSYQDARSKIKTIDRSKIIEVLLTSMLNK